MAIAADVGRVAGEYEVTAGDICLGSVVMRERDIREALEQNDPSGSLAAGSSSSTTDLLIIRRIVWAIVLSGRSDRPGQGRHVAEGYGAFGRGRVH